MKIKKKFFKLVSAALAAVMLLSALPMSALAEPAFDLPDNMKDHAILRALEYTGYDVQKQKNDGTLYQPDNYGSRTPSSVLSNISYGLNLSGKETVEKSGTATGRAPDIAKFEQSGLCCAGFVTYFMCNYLPNIEGADTQFITDAVNAVGMGSQAVETWQAALDQLAGQGKVEKIGTSPSDVDRSKLSPGDIIIFGTSSDSAVHIAVYSGTYNGIDFIIHVGNERGPEISRVDWMGQAGSKSSYPNAYYHIPQEVFESDGEIEVYKRDTDGRALAGAVFIAANTKTGKSYKIGPTNDSGYAKSENPIPYGTYTVKETVFPANYRAFGQSEWTVTVDSSNMGRVTINAINEEIPGSVKIVKTSEDGKVDNISFTITGNGINKTVKTNSNGEFQIDDLKPGVYTVTEQPYDKYVPQESRQVTVVSGEVAMVNFNNVLKRGDVQVIKSSEDNFVEGVTFHLYGTSLAGIAVNEYAVTDKNGVATFKNVLISGKTPYTLEEVDTAIRYVIPEKQTAPVLWKEVTSRSFTNILKKFTVTVTKRDAEKGLPQGNASLAGAKYGIFKGERLVDVYYTDKNGQFTSKEYVCGDNWTVKELEPSEGYLLDPTVHHVGAEPQLYTVEHNLTSNDVLETVIKGNIALIKHTDNGETHIETPEEGAEFEIYLKSAGSYGNADPDERDVIVCNENGFGQTKDMPYGIYTVHQTKGWEGRELMKDFDVFIAKDTQTYHYLINNANFESHVKVVKVDAETGKTIPYAGAGFQIYDPDGNLVTMTFTYPTPTTIDTFYTDAEGSFVTPEKLPYGKDYSIVEVQAPYGYVLDSTPIYFDVVEEHSTEESGVIVIKVDKPNMAQKGTVTVEKSGEVFFGVSAIGGVDKDGNELPTVYQPLYEVQGLPGAVYEIRAAEDIITPDGTLRASKGEVVDTVTTGADGLAKSKEIYLGKYEVQEITAPYGMVLNDEIHSVELVYVGQNVAVTETATSFYNERQKVEISLEKTLETRELFGIGNNGEIQNISFGLFAAEELISTSGTAIPADGLIEIITLDEDGKAIVKTDLPIGGYYVQELATDKAYILNDEKYPVIFEYAGQETATVEIAVNNGEAIENELLYGSVSGKKVDENGEALGGAWIGLFKTDKDEFTKENALMTTVSEKDGSFSFADIPYGTWYVREIEQPTGFVLDETVYPVTISEDEQIVEIEIVNKFIRGNIALTKVDADYPDNKLTGATFEVYKDSNDNGKLDENDELLGTLTEKEIGEYEMNDLLYGRYFVKETVAPEGFLLDEGVYEVFIDTDGKTYQVENKAGVGFINDAMKGNLKIVKTSSDGNVKGFAFRITGANGYDVTLETDENGEILIENLRIGEYTISEVSNAASANYVLPADKQATVQTGSITIVEMHNVLRDTPKTGDDSNPGLWIALAGLSLIGVTACGIVVFKKKKKGGISNGA